MADRPAQGVVRKGSLERVLMEHDAKIGVKMSLAMRIWYEQCVVPLEKRVAWLELPIYKRLWLRAKQGVYHAWYFIAHLPEKMPWKKTSAPST